jgi:regulator of sigma E protease
MAEIFSKNPGKELILVVNRGGELIEVRVTPKPTNVKNQAGEEVTIGRIGISKKIDLSIIQADRIYQAPLKGIEAVFEWCVLVFSVVGKLLTGALSSKQIGGPILIVDAASKAASAGVYPYFNFIAIISINLAILNLLPIPVLDGGHLMFMSIEALRGKPLNERVMNLLTRVGMAFLFLLIALVFYNDIIRIIIPWIQKTFTH